MQISEMGGNKVKITLTDTEVICCFGAYERLFAMSAGTKNAIKALLSDIIEEHYGYLKNDKISAEIRGGKNIGCVIILSCRESSKKQKEYLISFENSEALIAGSLLLYRVLRKRRCISSLYRTSSRYFLLISCDTDKKRLSALRKFSYDICADSVKIEYIKEHGTAITKKNALYKIASAFSKEI